MDSKYNELKNVVMNHGVSEKQLQLGMRELTAQEIDCVNGGVKIGPFNLSFDLSIRF